MCLRLSGGHRNPETTSAEVDTAAQPVFCVSLSSVMVSGAAPPGNITVFCLGTIQVPFELGRTLVPSILQPFFCRATLIYGPHNKTCTYCSRSKSAFRCRVRKKPSSSEVFRFQRAICEDRLQLSARLEINDRDGLCCKIAMFVLAETCFVSHPLVNEML